MFFYRLQIGILYRNWYILRIVVDMQTLQQFRQAVCAFTTNGIEDHNSTIGKTVRNALIVLM
jgi:hypothetical protein